MTAVDLFAVVAVDALREDGPVDADDYVLD